MRPLRRRGIHAQSRRPLADILHRLGIDIELRLRQIFHCLSLFLCFISIGEGILQLFLTVVYGFDASLRLLVGRACLGGCRLGPFICRLGCRKLLLGLL